MEIQRILPSAQIKEEDLTDGNIDLISLLVNSGLANTRSEARRAIEQGGVAIDGEKVTDIKFLIPVEKLQGEGIVLKKGKKNFRKVTMA